MGLRDGILGAIVGASLTLLFLAPLLMSGGEDPATTSSISTPSAVVPIAVKILPSRNTSSLKAGPCVVVNGTQYEEIPGVDYNMGRDVSEPLNDIAPGEAGRAACTEACEANPRCGAFVLAGTSCWLKEAPAVIEVRSATSTSFVRQDMALQYFSAPNFTSRIVFGMLAAPQYLASRAAAALSTWLCSYSVLLLIEDIAGSQGKFAAMLASLPAACRAGKIARFRSVPDRSYNGAWKDIPLTRLLVEAYPGRDWYAIVDDDTFVLMHNLNLELSTFYSSDEEICIGVQFFYTDGPEHFPFAQGGAGIFLSRSAIFKVSAMRFTCMDRCKQWAGDIRLGCCLRLATVRIVQTENLWSRTPFLAVGADKRHHSSAFPVSFHQMRNPLWTRDLAKWSSDATRDVAAACTDASKGFAESLMCRIWRKQRVMCREGSSRDGRRLTVPLTWDALRLFLRRDGAFEPSLFLAEKPTQG